MLSLFIILALFVTAVVLLVIATRSWRAAPEACLVMVIWLIGAAIVRLALQLELVGPRNALAISGSISFGVLPNLIYLAVWRFRA